MTANGWLTDCTAVQILQSEVRTGVRIGHVTTLESPAWLSSRRAARKTKHSATQCRPSSLRHGPSLQARTTRRRPPYQPPTRARWPHATGRIPLAPRSQTLLESDARLPRLLSELCFEGFHKNGAPCGDLGRSALGHTKSISIPTRRQNFSIAKVHTSFGNVKHLTQVCFQN